MFNLEGMCDSELHHAAIWGNTWQWELSNNVKLNDSDIKLLKRPNYSQTCIKRPLKGNVKSGLLKRWSLKKGFL